MGRERSRPMPAAMSPDEWTDRCRQGRQPHSLFDPRTLREMNDFAAPEPCAMNSPSRLTASSHSCRCMAMASTAPTKNPTTKFCDRSDAPRACGYYLARRVCRAAWHGRDGTTIRLWPSAIFLASPLLVNLRQAHRRSDKYDCPSHGPHTLTSRQPDGTRFYVVQSAARRKRALPRNELVATIPIGAPGATQGNGSGSEGNTDAGGRQAYSLSTTIATTFTSSTQHKAARSICVALIVAVRCRMEAFPPRQADVSPDGCQPDHTAYAGGTAWHLDPNNYRQ